MALGEDVGQLFEEDIQLGRRDAVVLRIHQRGVQRQHAQQGQGLEDGETVLIHVLHQAQDLLPFALQVGVVDLAVLRRQLDVEDLLLLGRQVGGHGVLGAPEHERADPAT